MSDTEECEVYSPMTGTITMVYAQDGESVGEGERIIGVEAMKMIHDINAPFAGKVKHVRALGDVVGEDDVVAIIVIDF